MLSFPFSYKLENDESVTSESCVESSWADRTGLDEDGMSSLDLVSSLDKKPRFVEYLYRSYMYMYNIRSVQYITVYHIHVHIFVNELLLPKS